MCDTCFYVMSKFLESIPLVSLIRDNNTSVSIRMCSVQSLCDMNKQECVVVRGVRRFLYFVCYAAPWVLRRLSNQDTSEFKMPLPASG